MHDGTTPLILAARLAIEGMVEDLINADADINAADNSGKTALHWGAAVNNVDAVNILLSHGANRDAQDDKVSQTCCRMLSNFPPCQQLQGQAVKELTTEDEGSMML